MVEKNERTKALIKKRDEASKARQLKLLEVAAQRAEQYTAQRKKALDYCTARGGFGDGNKRSAVKRVNHFKRSASQEKLLTKLSPQYSGSPKLKRSPNRSTVNIDL